MLKIENIENYTVAKNIDNKSYEVHLSFRLSDDGVNYTDPKSCLGFLHSKNNTQDIVEYFYQDYKEYGYEEVELIAIYVDVDSLKKLKKVKKNS